MIVFQTNSAGVFVGPVQADPSPLEPGVWLIPGGCVETPPPDTPEGTMAVWQDDAWVLQPLPVDPQEPTQETTPPTPEQLLAEFTAAIDAHVESTARAKQYNSAAHLASYVASTVPTWAAEAEAFVAWRDQVWLFALAELAAIQAGDKPVPTIAVLVASLPEIEWP
jgi:hypothetical protein